MSQPLRDRRGVYQLVDGSDRGPGHICDLCALQLLTESARSGTAVTLVVD